MAVAEVFSFLLSRLGFLNQRKELLKFAMILSSLTLVAYLGLTNFNKVNLRYFTLGDDLGFDVLATAEPNSIVILQDDTVTFNTQYIYYASNVRPDIILIAPGQMRKFYYREFLRKKYSNLSFSEPEKINGDAGYKIAFFTKLLVENNLNHFPIYSYSTGPNVDGWEWVPVGVMIKLYKSDQLPAIADYAKLQERTWSKYKFKVEDANQVYRQLVVDHIVSVYKYAYYDVGLYFLKLDQKEKAFDNFDQALKIDPYFSKVRLKLAEFKEKEGDCYGAKEDLEVVVNNEKVNTDALEALSNLYENCLKDGTKAAIFKERLAKIKRDSSKTDSLEKF
jgi:tetratricopeptide (TPR) repeat protein